ncbi:hypothetical protein LAZ67_3002276 [Cordylochernes scorpioides]|uniref:Uncharacterized protein n=1 Tax=Cordylochernes scorpioides TaxID=51811 RepID=A0ABY6K955_9ARAC|nr:hypothetical protein LAZ67_3002276 [Cordylochernes scorpioides]
MILGKKAQNVQRITDLIKENPRTTLLELEQDTGISKTTIGRIVTKDLKLKKTPAKFIPRFLTNEQKLCWLATCENMLEMTRTDPEWKDKIITGDETWVYDYDPETKRQYAERRGQGEPRPKKSRILKSRNKVLLVAFLDNKGIVHHEYLPAGQTVIKEMYLDILRHLREEIRKKMPEKWPNDLISTLQLEEKLDRYPLRNKRKIDPVEPEEASMNVNTESDTQDVLCLSKEVDPQMSEEIPHLMKGIAEELYQALLARDVQSTEQFITECCRVEALHCRYERLPNVASLCDQDDGEDLSSLIRKIIHKEIQQALHSPQEEPIIAAIEDFVREEIVKS